MSDSSSSTSQNFENMDGIAQIDPDTDSQSFDQSGNQHLPDDELVKEGGLYGDEDSQTRSAALVNDEEEGEYYDEDMINLDNNDLNYEEEEAEYGSADSDSRLLHLPDENEEQIDREMTQVSDTEDDTEMPENGVNGNHENGAFVRGEELTLENIPADEISAGEEEDGHQNQAIETELGSEEGELLEDDEEEGMKGKAEELTEHDPVDDLDLEDGEIVDSSDDGIPEIKDGGLSPPSATKLSNNRQTSSQQCYISSGSSPYNSRTRYQLVEKEREVCRFFLRGNCKNGELCRFKHTRDASSRVQSVSSSICSGKVVPNYYNRAPIPPPVGPPISLLSTEFAPPPSLMVRPSAPVNAESAAWEQGLKKARELVRRQKGESIDEKESENSAIVDENQQQQQFESSGSPPLATISPDPYSPTVEPYDNNSLRSFTSSHSISTLNRRPIASRVVVEAVSVVTAPLKESSSRLASRVVRPVSTTKPRTIPSLIDEIFEHPITEPPPAPLEEPKTRREERGSRQTLSGTRYSDPWARHGKNNSIDKREDRRHMDRHRKRHHSTSSASPSENDEKRPHIHRQRHHRQKEGERQQSRRYSQQNDEFVDEGKVVAEKERGIKRRISEEEQRESRKKTHQRTDENMDKDSKGAVKKRKTESEESSSLTFQHEKVWHQKNQAKKIRSNSMSSSSSSSSTESVKKSATLGALLVSPSKDGIKNKGPKTPPEEDRQSSRNSSNSSTSTWNRDKRHSGGASPPSMVHGRTSKRRNSQIKRETQRNRQSVKSKVDKSGFFSKENDEDDAPAAYRIPRRVQGIESGRELNKNRRLSRSSSLSSSSSSSSATSSTNSAISSPSHQKAKIGKSVLEITNEQKVEENALVSKAIICSSTREPKTPPLDDERMDRISSGDEEPNEMIKIGMTPRKPVSEDFSPSNSPTETGNKFMNSFVKAENNGEQKDVHNKIANEEVCEQMNKKLDDGNKGGNTPKELEEANNRKPKSDVKNKELTQKRREELRRKLQSVEEAIARKKQQQTAQKDE